ncbi:Lactoylglutathione lyase, partial [Dysosmobacter welbionis]
GLDPGLGALRVDLDLSRGDAGVVSADLLDEAAVPGETGVRYHNAVERSLLGAKAAQSDFHHNLLPPTVNSKFFIYKCIALISTLFQPLLATEAVHPAAQAAASHFGKPSPGHLLGQLLHHIELLQQPVHIH